MAKRSSVRLIGNLDLDTRRRFRQDERFADFEIFDDERSSFEELLARFQRESTKPAAGKMTWFSTL